MPGEQKDKNKLSHNLLEEIIVNWNMECELQWMPEQHTDPHQSSGKNGGESRF